VTVNVSAHDILTTESTADDLQSGLLTMPATNDDLLDPGTTSAANNTLPAPVTMPAANATLQAPATVPIVNNALPVPGTSDNLSPAHVTASVPDTPQCQPSTSGTIEVCHQTVFKSSFLQHQC
jgi:hypothetical protein